MKTGRSRAVWGLILAGGLGRRYGKPKQFEALGTERMVDRVVRILGGVADATVLVLPAGVVWDGKPVDKVVVGGNSHMSSARLGVQAIPSEASTILIGLPSHPLATTSLHRRLLTGLAETQAAACAPGSPLPDALKQVENGQVVRTQPREDLLSVPFPAAFDASKLRLALSAEVDGAMLDGAVLDCAEETEAVELIGGKVSIIANEPTNLHITTPQELAMARLLLPLVD